ncbi:cytochrome P450 [Armillaria borealis]|uniref:Cytochrome P450 n=1 Tax=Armillaria borealis TaxID=47425 RepID=A0AA39KBS4_9AGAR|nr:cytochrome P450 [Armillaria borealis]
MALNDSSRSASSTSGASFDSFPSVFSLPSSQSATWLVTTTVILVTLLILEQSVYRYKKRHLPGDKWTYSYHWQPTMEGYMRQWNSGALSAISVFNIFIVMASSTEVFLTGKEHVDYRRSLNALFTRKAIGMYVAIQDVITRQHFKEWLAEAAKDPSPKPIMMTARHLNMDTSLRVFCGNYIPEHATREISEKYWAITLALELVNFPLALPGTKIYKAIQSRKVAMYWLELAAASSKAAMAKGGEPACLLDEWVRILQDPSWKGRRDFSNHEMAMVIFSFLFASQDAMSSGLIYGFQHLADRPDILAKVREEQERVRQGNYDAPLTIEMMDEMPYLQAFVKESMRIKPPVTMVPYKTTKAFPIANDYTVPAGSMIIPSFYNALHDSEVFPDPDALQPERWLDPQSSANTNPKNYLVFGAGPHKCIGLEYAMMNIALVLGTAAVMFDWEHDVTPKSEQVEIIATLFPKDGCRLKLTPR